MCLSPVHLIFCWIYSVFSCDFGIKYLTIHSRSRVVPVLRKISRFIVLTTLLSSQYRIMGHVGTLWATGFRLQYMGSIWPRDSFGLHLGCPSVWEPTYVPSCTYLMNHYRKIYTYVENPTESQMKTAWPSLSSTHVHQYHQCHRSPMCMCMCTCMCLLAGNDLEMRTWLH